MTYLASIPEYRTIWISDLHLGTRGCKAEFFLDFLRYTEAETIYLVGDIIDGWRLKKSWYWPQAHNDVIQKVRRKVRKGTRVVYVPGNHDEWLRDFTQHPCKLLQVNDVARMLTVVQRGLASERWHKFCPIDPRWTEKLQLPNAYTKSIPR